jgi:hypothetical protein
LSARKVPRRKAGSKVKAANKTKGRKVSTKKAAKRKAPSDDTSAASTSQSKRSNRNLTDDELYEKLKKKVNDSNNKLAEIDDTEQSNVQSIHDQIVTFFKAIKGHYGKIMYYYCMIGRNFMLLKETFNVTDTAMDNILNLLDLDGYSKPSRNFYIDLYKFSEKYKKLRHVGMPYSEIRTRFRMIKKRIRNDKDFDWS